MSSGSNEVREENTEVLIRMIHYYGFSPKLLCEELYTVLMNSFLHSVTEIKEALVEQHPERSKDLHDCFTKLLEKESFGLFQILHKFKDYFIHNFKISPAVSLYPIRNASLRKGGLMKLREWSRKTRAVKELNKKLREAIVKTKKMIAVREDILKQIAQVKKEKAELTAGSILVNKLRSELQSLTNNT